MSNRAWGIALALAGVLGFSMRPILIKLCYAAAPVSPTTLIFLRMLLSLPVFAATAWWLRRQEPALTGRDWAAIVALGVLGYYAASFLDFVGLQWIGAGVGRLIQFLYPTMVLLLSAMFLGKHPSRRELAALVITYAGVALVVSGHGGAESDSHLFLAGAALVLVSGIFYAVYLVAGSRIVQRIGSMRFTAYTMCVSTAPVVLQFLLLEPLSALELPAPVWWYAGVMAVFGTALPVFFAAEALKRIGANQFALIGAAGPVSVALTSSLGLDEPLSLPQIVGGVLVICGVLLVSLQSASFPSKGKR
ncbi:MAG: DMT family transporter [Betaproteobacteria bacterium]|nr:DMT family transporter [Betaproteobacteria bacterium]